MGSLDLTNSLDLEAALGDLYGSLVASDASLDNSKEIHDQDLRNIATAMVDFAEKKQTRSDFFSRLWSPFSSKLI